VSDAGAAVAAGLGVGIVVSLLVAAVRLGAPPPGLMRVNFAGAEVPAVLGDAVVVGSLVAIGLLAAAGVAGWAAAEATRAGAAAALVTGVFGAAGRADDLRGDERERGFGGHLKAAARGRLTGGGLKIIAGGLAGLAAGAIIESGPDIVVVAALVALAANTLNLFDRAPGRAGKVWLCAAIPLFIWGSADWAVAAAGMTGALLVVLPADLSARGMLGDAGANPLGAVWGLGLAAATGTFGRIVTIAVLLVLNLASERWSFSAAIDRTPILSALDRLGRK
jgi:hypothetical protein